MNEERDDLVSYINNKIEQLYGLRPDVRYTRTGFFFIIRLNNIFIDVTYRKIGHLYQIEYQKVFNDDEEDQLLEYYEFDHFDDVLDLFDDIINTMMPPKIYY